ncbi:CBN-SIR-2.2 protein [Caenorhabditis brenneri]|uniref:CBN-SIR-2.2 protein n=1 Tax=Caenorhabditis brenneri TaxID=135651 RepID=G0MAP3_CAEBE|nr:CBN-SIR-2.2 protein [Caenorhabditis brenneri]
MSQRFVPEAAQICEKTLKKFVSEVSSIEKLVVITGAGISTESVPGIPDYRSKDVGLYARISHKPIFHQDYMTSNRCRQRYWTRNFLAWPRFGQAAPNVNHYLLSKWEVSDRFHWLITQNVDGLHSKQSYQEKLDQANPGFKEKYVAPGELAPDGDMQLPLGTEKGFKIPECPCCGGLMKTAVTFFGDNVPWSKVEYCYEKVDEADGILALGTSLAVLSGFRFVHHANMHKKPIFIVNIGPTRADHMVTMKVDYKISDVLKKM